MPAVDTESLLTPSQAARIMGISVRRVYQFCEQNRLSKTIIAGRWFIRRDEARKFRPNPTGRPKAPKS